MGDYVVKLPDVGEGIAEAEIVEWHVQVGDTIAEDQVMVEVMTDKATVELPSPVAGIVVSVGAAVGDVLAVGAPLIRIDTGGETAGDDSSAPSTEPAAGPPVALAPPPSAPTAQTAPPARLPDDRGRPTAAPAVRQRAATLGIDLLAVEGTGPGGRTRSDRVSGGKPAHPPG